MPQFGISLPRKDDPRFMACCVLSENLLQFDFREFSHRRLEINRPRISSDSTSRNPVDLNQMSVEARQLVYIYLDTDQEAFDSGICEQRD
jgi:hypothetical protein